MKQLAKPVRGARQSVLKMISDQCKAFVLDSGCVQYTKIYLEYPKTKEQKRCCQQEGVKMLKCGRVAVERQPGHHCHRSHSDHYDHYVTIIVVSMSNLAARQVRRAPRPVIETSPRRRGNMHRRP